MKTIRIFQSLPARSARIFQALTTARDLAAWHADVVKGRVEPGRTLELSWPRLGASLELSVERVVTGKRVVFTSDYGTLDLTIENGGVELCHSGPFEAETASGLESSWRVTLAVLWNYLGRHVDHERHVHWSLARVRAGAELCHAYFSDARLLSSWFGDVENSVGAVESKVNLNLGGAFRLRGPVLANSEGRDIALRWQEADDSVLVLRTLPAPDASGWRYALLGWSRWSEPPNAPAITRELDAAAERLERHLNALASA